MSDSSSTTATIAAKHPASRHVVIVGAGLAGLTCAKQLAPHRNRITLLEASDRVGGRVRTDVVDGFQLDHGFQVLLTAYPACRELLDYDNLRLRPFQPGALVRKQGRFAILADPWRRPGKLLSTAISPVGTLSDKWNVAKARRLARRGSLNDLYQRPHSATSERLAELGFSTAMIDEFFRPFLGGVFLDETLSTSSRMFEFVFRMFAEGDIALPADGMAAIPRQLAEGLPRGTLRLNATVARLEHLGETTRVHLTDGETLDADELVIATESDAAARLLNVPDLVTSWNQTATLYFAADTSPQTDRMLMLRGDEDGAIQTAVVLSDVAPEYAPPGKALISISVSQSALDLESRALESAVREHAARWFDAAVNRWDLLQIIRVPYGLPRVSLEPVAQPLRAGQVADQDAAGMPLPEHVYLCGDHRETPSIQGAMNSGLRVAREIVAEAASVAD
jgi:phytoene dehydrogenase-like protein